MRKQIEIPKNCPTCDSVLELINSQLFCRNIMCPARAAKGLEHFAKTLNIKGLGPESIKKLGISHYIEIYNLTEAEITEKLGSDKIAKKLIEQIEQSKDAKFADIIAAFGIPKIGKVLANKLTPVNSVKDLTVEKCKELGLGNVATNSLIEFLNNEFKDIEPFLPFSQLYCNNSEIKDLDTVDIVCITGKLKSFKTKEEAKVILEANGYTVVDSLSKKVTILIDEEDKNSSKRQKAEQMGIPIVNNILTLIKEEK